MLRDRKNKAKKSVTASSSPTSLDVFTDLLPKNHPLRSTWELNARYKDEEVARFTADQLAKRDAGQPGRWAVETTVGVFDIVAKRLLMLVRIVGIDAVDLCGELLSEKVKQVLAKAPKSFAHELGMRFTQSLAHWKAEALKRARESQSLTGNIRQMEEADAPPQTASVSSATSGRAATAVGRAKKQSHATLIPTQWNELLSKRSISQIETASYLGCDPRTVRRRLVERELDKTPKGRVICNERLRHLIRQVHGAGVLR